MFHRFFLIALLLLVTIGCRPSATPAKAPAATDPAAQSLRLLVIDDEELARVIERQWTAHGESPLQVRLLSQDEFLSKPPRRLGADVVIYPSAMIGELAGRDWLQPLSDQELSNTEFQWRDIWELPRLQEIKWGSATLAVPLGSPALILCYRPDVFERLSLSVPKTWAEYQSVVSQLGATNPETKAGATPTQGSCEPIGGGWAGELLLARAAAYAKHPSQYSTLFDYRDMKPLIAGPPFVRALEELVAAQVPRDRSEADWQSLRKTQDTNQVCKMFMEGNCAMAITWPSVLPSDSAAANFPIAFAPLPGSSDTYNFRTSAWDQHAGNHVTSVPLVGTRGRLASVTKESRELSKAMTFLFFVAGPELSGPISSSSKHTTLFRDSHVAQVDRWLGARYGQESAQKYAESAKELFNQGSCLLTLRVAGRQRYLAALDDAVWLCITGKANAKDALQGAADKWESITNELGRDAQRKAYTLSIGLEP